MNYKLIDEHPKRKLFGDSPNVKGKRNDVIRGDGLHKFTR